MSAPIPLRRRRSSLDPDDLDSVREAILTEVQDEVRLAGEPRPRILAVGDEFTETLDLSTLSKADPDADIGATFQALGARPGVAHRFLIFRLHFEDGDQERLAAMVVHVTQDVLTGFLLGYQSDPRTGLGLPESAWRMGDREGLGPFWPAVQPLVEPAPGGRPAVIVPAGKPAPNVRAAFGELPPGAPPPTNVQQVADLAGRMTRDQILRHGLDGPMVVRFSGRVWESWLLGSELPTDLSDHVRYICNRDPKADAVAVLHIALFPGGGPPQPGIQIVAEQAGERFELFCFLELTEGLSGPRKTGRIVGRALPRPGEDEGWLGVEVDLGFELGPLGVAE